MTSIPKLGRVPFSWLVAGALVVLLGALAVLQYQWIGEVSLAERERMRATLQSSLFRASQDFNQEISSACFALMPPNEMTDPAEREKENSRRYLRWKETTRQRELIRRVGVARMTGSSTELRMLDLASGAFSAQAWPKEWASVERRFEMRPGDEPPAPRPPFGSLPEDELNLVEIPHFNRPEPGAAPPPRFRARGAGERLIVELDLDYVRSTLIPELVQRHLGAPGAGEYLVEVTARNRPGTLIYSSQPDAPRIGSQADATVGMFEVQMEQVFRRPGFPRRAIRGPAGPPTQPDRGRWILAARHHAGSLDAVVNQVRWRNLGVTSAIFLLLLAALAALVRYTQRAQHLAQLQMDFVAGVSHELRTPLSVIRTAGHNLGGGLVRDEKQVQRYGTLIREEAERLSGIVEQVLRFARRGEQIRAREPVPVETLIDDALQSTASVLRESGCEVDKKIAPGLPPLLADPVALRHALQNLLTNAAKYAREGGWIGVFAELSSGGSAVDIRVADRGPGIPPDELGQVFDPFYRGKRATEGQIHGTGLGLSLVKRILEAHEGSVTARSEPGKGSEFVLRVPTVPMEQQDEFAHSFNRG